MLLGQKLHRDNGRHIGGVGLQGRPKLISGYVLIRASQASCWLSPQEGQINV